MRVRLVNSRRAGGGGVKRPHFNRRICWKRRAAGAQRVVTYRSLRWQCFTKIGLDFPDMVLLVTS